MKFSILFKPLTTMEEHQNKEEKKNQSHRLWHMSCTKIKAFTVPPFAVLLSPEKKNGSPLLLYPSQQTKLFFFSKVPNLSSLLPFSLFLQSKSPTSLSSFRLSCSWLFIANVECGIFLRGKRLFLVVVLAEMWREHAWGWSHAIWLACRFVVESAGVRTVGYEPTTCWSEPVSVGSLVQNWSV